MGATGGLETVRARVPNKSVGIGTGGRVLMLVEGDKGVGLTTGKSKQKKKQH